jgi:hypothetical protein
MWDYFGYDVATAGDIDRDGRPDVVVGSLKYARVFSGRDGRVLFNLRNPSLRFGVSVAGVGDLNGDGQDDLGWERWRARSSAASRWRSPERHWPWRRTATKSHSRAAVPSGWTSRWRRWSTPGDRSSCSVLRPEPGPAFVVLDLARPSVLMASNALRLTLIR